MTLLKTKREPKGIGGWLILPTLFLVLIAIISLFGIITAIYDRLYSQTEEHIYTFKDAARDVGIRRGLSGEELDTLVSKVQDYRYETSLLTALPTAVIAMLALFLGFKKSKYFPACAKWTFYCYLALNLYVYRELTFPKGTYSLLDYLPWIVFVLLMVGYLETSKRVKNTFVK